eukprot:m51a1_g13327 hypothetical protein (161) ;mRNA; f:248-881
MLAAHLGDEQHPDVDMLWSIADTYKHACLLAQETDLESEAVALSRLGVMFDKVFKPRSLAGLDWYEAATEALQRELEAVAKQGDQELLDHVYLKHPPKDGSAKPTGQAMAKMLLKALGHYHPDRQVHHDKKWQVLCEEIANHFSGHYQLHKERGGKGLTD